jgi:hypothetical protein
MSMAMIARRPPAVLQVSCPDCGAAPSEACRDRGGETRYLDHLSRCRAAALVRLVTCAAVLETEARIAAAGSAI